MVQRTVPPGKTDFTAALSFGSAGFLSAPRTRQRSRLSLL